MCTLYIKVYTIFTYLLNILTVCTQFNPIYHIFKLILKLSVSQTTSR